MHKIKKLIKLFVPEIIIIILKFFKTKKGAKLSDGPLFDGYNELYKKNLSPEIIYGEYGCGQSTIYVSKNFDIPIYSVDSSRYWIDEVKKNCNENMPDINYINIGNNSPNSFGRPEDYTMRENIMKYATDIWMRKSKPNLVLVDGRFRVLCFLVSIKHCDEKTKIIFDDYVNRKYYHIVEELVKPKINDGRQSLFEINDKGTIDMTKLEFLIQKFNYVMD